VYANRREDGRTAATLPAARTPPPAKYPRSPPHGPGHRNWTRYRRFLRHGLRRTLELLADLVRDSPPPFQVRPPGTRGRPPTDPRDVARFLLFRTLERASFDTAHALLTALPGLTRLLGFRKVPAASTAAQLVARVPATYLEALLRALAERLLGARPTNLAGDGTGLSTRPYARWLAVRTGSEPRPAFVKLHALVATRARFPWFAAARVTDAFTNDVSELPSLLARLPTAMRLGNVALDRGYLSRKNAQAVADRGGRPVIELKRIIGRIDAGGAPAWARMIRDRREDGRRFRCRYRRRSVIEGVFGAVKARFGPTVRCRRPETQAAELLGRTVVWNALALVHDGA
jgi:transposase